MITATTSVLPATSAFLNGIDTNALSGALAAVAADPSLAPVAFRATTSWQGRLRSRTEIASYDLAGHEIPRRHTIHADEPTEILGENTAPNPQDLLLAALNACMLVGFVVGCTARGVVLESLSIESAIVLDLRGAFGIDPTIKPGADRIRYTIRVKGAASRETFEDIHREMMATYEAPTEQ